MVGLAEKSDGLGGADQGTRWSEVLQKGPWLLKDPFSSSNAPGADQGPELAIYEKVLQDIERLLQVVPVKIQAQKQLDEALGTIKSLNSRIEHE